MSNNHFYNQVSRTSTVHTHVKFTYRPLHIFIKKLSQSISAYVPIMFALCTNMLIANKILHNYIDIKLKLWQIFFYISIFNIDEIKTMKCIVIQQFSDQLCTHEYCGDSHYLMFLSVIDGYTCVI